MTMTRPAFRILSQAVEEVLGTMFFVFVQPIPLVDEIEPGWTEQPWYTAEIKFDGPWQGFIKGFFPAQAANLMTANFMGLDEDSAIEPAMVEDSVKELINMIGGRMMVLLEPDKSSGLGLPQAGQAAWDDVSGLIGADDAALFESDEGLLVFKMELEQAA